MASLAEPGLRRLRLLGHRWALSCGPHGSGLLACPGTWALRQCPACTLLGPEVRAFLPGIQSVWLRPQKRGRDDSFWTPLCGPLMRGCPVIRPAHFCSIEIAFDLGSQRISNLFSPVCSCKDGRDHAAPRELPRSSRAAGAESSASSCRPHGQTSPPPAPAIL